MKSIRDLLSGRAPISLPGTATVLDAAKTMDEARIGALLVMGKTGLAGIFTERDLMNRVVVRGLDPSEVKLQEVMTKDLYWVDPERRINEVARELQSRHVRHVPVVEAGEVLGMLSLRDLLAEHLNVKRSEVQALTAYIQGEGEVPPPEPSS